MSNVHRAQVAAVSLVLLGVAVVVTLGRGGRIDSLREAAEPRGPLNAGVDLSHLRPGRLVSVMLPVSGRVIVADPVSGRAVRLRSLEQLSFKGLAASIQVHDRLIVLEGAAPSRVAAIDLLNGEVTASEPIQRFAGRAMAYSAKGKALFVAGDSGDGRQDGSVLAVNPMSLEIQRSAQVPSGQEALVGDAAGGIYSLSSDYQSLTRVDWEGGDSKGTSTRGVSFGATLGPKDGVFITRYRSGRVLSLSPEGESDVIISGVETGPWGIALGKSGIGIVVAEGSTREPGRAYIVDVLQKEIQEVIDLGCVAPREVIMVRDLAVITCIGPPSLAVVDLKRQRLARTLDLSRFVARAAAGFEQPRGLGLLQVDSIPEPRR